MLEYFYFTGELNTIYNIDGKLAQTPMELYNIAFKTNCQNKIMKIKGGPSFYNENTETFEDLESFLKFYKSNFSENTNIIIEILISLPWKGFNKYEIHFSESKTPIFLIALYDKDFEVSDRIVFHANKYGGIEVYWEANYYMYTSSHASKMKDLIEEYNQALKDNCKITQHKACLYNTWQDGKT